MVNLIPSAKCKAAGVAVPWIPWNGSWQPSASQAGTSKGNSTPQAHPRFQTWLMVRQLRITDLHTTQTGTRNRRKSFVDVAVLVSHGAQFSFPKASVRIAN